MISRMRHIYMDSGRSGTTMVEALFSIVVVGVLLVAGLETLGASQLGQQKSGFRKIAHLLADQLMAEILQQEYEELKDAPVFGLETGESTGTRAAFDDVDDYANWTASPPEEKDGKEIADREGWTRSVKVRWAASNDLRQLGLSGSGIKMITVTVLHDNVELAKLVSIRTGKSKLGPPVEIK